LGEGVKRTHHSDLDPAPLKVRYCSETSGLRTNRTKRGCDAPHLGSEFGLVQTRLRARLKSPFTVFLISCASPSSCPSSSHQHTGHRARMFGASRVRNPQHGHRKRSVAVPMPGWTEFSVSRFTEMGAGGPPNRVCAPFIAVSSRWVGVLSKARTAAV